MIPSPIKKKPLSLVLFFLGMFRELFDVRLFIVLLMGKVDIVSTFIFVGVTKVLYMFIDSELIRIVIIEYCKQWSGT